jgi:hypothetical protein
MKTLMFVCCIAASMPAHALTAFLQSCAFGTSVSGQSVYVGIYSVNGQTFSRTFPAAAGWCPQTLEVY